MNREITAEEISAQEWKRWIGRYQWHLDQTPSLLEAMREAASGIRAVVYDRDRVDASREGVPLPFREEVVDDADELWRALVGYGRAVASRIGGGPAALDALWARGAAGGLRSGTDPETARLQAYEIVVWLVEHIADVAQHADLEGDEAHLFYEIRRLRARYTSDRVKPRAVRACTLCGAPSVSVEWLSLTEEIAECGYCGHSEHRSTSNPPRSEPCAEAAHSSCESLLCRCDCHDDRTTSLYSVGVPVHILRARGSTWV
ncbi:hypothetical protein ACWKWN_08685 [Microbacterium trichothecenolyticum]